MTRNELESISGVPLDWVCIRVEAGIIETAGGAPASWRFSSRDLWRTRQLQALERDFDAPPELAALVIDLQEEIARLRSQLGSDAID